MHFYHIPSYTIQNRNVHISVLNGVLWDMRRGHCGICEIRLWLLFIFISEHRVCVLQRHSACARSSAKRHTNHPNKSIPWKPCPVPDAASSHLYVHWSRNQLPTEWIQHTNAKWKYTERLSSPGIFRDRPHVYRTRILGGKTHINWVSHVPAGGLTPSRHITQ